ncbi:GNAT family N-acetyltransferase [Solirubrobacter ginsenosidimutans]|uniref:GNAT family N-acetyltransferase n=1 Tax=Solirubrobacter ginsenosidimutans TaxID=490573 RepID=A0A9X3S0J8_9ACTN|nr:GNAT family N-acetyltransferase [Solirubrobacter ginsenosidimutans]MDA0160172.1 GNAT family N-acetyltransferase [Solirubrobacter ginsenosidimutans]
MLTLGADDAGEVLTLQRAAYVGEAMIYDQFLPPLFETLDEVKDVLASEITVLGIRDDGRLIGTVRIKPDGEIARLAVAPDRQHEGLGTRLLEAAIAHGGTWLFTGDRSEANLRLYRRHGFEETRREPVPGHELVYLTRPAA